MRIGKEQMLLYVVTDRSWLKESNLADQVEEILKNGATLLQLREKRMAFEEYVSEAKKMKQITSRYHLPLIINDRIDVALASEADGVHLGQEDEALAKARERLGINKIIGISAHTVSEAVRAQENGADYIGVGAVFSTSTKKNARPVTFEELNEICHAVTIPVVAIGGVTEDNIMKLSGSGVDGVAVISAIFSKKDVGSATGMMRKLAINMIAQNNKSLS